jgi:ring-1,2-phenylacetyl-CoA epoxidase subunit PaaE
MDLLHWKIINIIDETPETKTYVLEATDNRAVSYDAGQFLTFLIPFRGREIRRSYSLSSTPGVDKHVSITVKKKINGELSRYIHENWHKGTLVTSIAPAGLFRIATRPDARRHFYFIAAGSGIVPVFSLLKKVLHFEPGSRATLIYQNYDEAHIIFHTSLQQLEKQFGDRFHRIDLLSRPLHAQHKPHRLNNALLEGLIRATHHLNDTTLFYTCGPLLFMKMVEFTVRVMGFAAEQVRKENFTVDTIPPPPFTLEPAPRQVTVHYGQETFRFTSAWPRTILQAALDNHIALPYSCRGGRCSSCVARCVSGSVKMSINDVLTDKDMREGLVLTCVGYAETDVVLEF